MVLTSYLNDRTQMVKINNMLGNEKTKIVAYLECNWTGFINYVHK